MGTTTSLSNLKEVADTLNSQFSIIESALGKISTDLVNKVKEVASSSSDIDSVYNQLVNIGKELKTIGTSQNTNLEKLYDVTKDKKNDLKYLKNKTQELKAAMQVSQKMIDNMANKPVTQTWYEYK
jgi:chromosome segregation ATPase